MSNDVELKKKFLLGSRDYRGDVIVAVSGGADSVALLWFFKQFWDRKIIVAHAEHGLRGLASVQDADFVRELAQKWGFECVVRNLDTLQNKQKGESVEMAARRLRYGFLEEICRERSCRAALGHNRDDVAETVLMNIFRGTGVRGLAGIPRERGVFFRPLLDFSHEELCGILRARKIEWREDATNSENNYLRNKIRNVLLPQIKRDINARAVEHIASLADEMRVVREREEMRGTEILENLGRDEKKFSIKKLRALADDDIKIFIREVGRRMNLRALSRERTENLTKLIRTSGRFIFQWEKNVEFVAQNGLLIVKIV